MFTATSQRILVLLSQLCRVRSANISPLPRGYTYRQVDSQKMEREACPDFFVFPNSFVTGLCVIADNDGFSEMRPMSFDVIRVRSASRNAINNLSVSISGHGQS